MKKIEENLILQNSDLLIKTLSILTEKLIKYIERAKNIIILNTYFNFVRISDPKSPGDDFYAFQKCLLLQGIDKNEPPVIEKRNILKLNMNNIISKRIPEDVGKFKYYEKFTKNNFCHGEFCHYVVPSFFKGIKYLFNSKTLAETFGILRAFHFNTTLYCMPSEVRWASNRYSGRFR